MSEAGQDKGNRAVFWELGLAVKEKDPTYLPSLVTRK